VNVSPAGIATTGGTNWNPIAMRGVAAAAGADAAPTAAGTNERTMRQAAYARRM
jgi:hypothetical protein